MLRNGSSVFSMLSVAPALGCMLCIATLVRADESPGATKTASTTHQAAPFAAMPYGITSFGAARLGDSIYVYGGHTGRAHSYSNTIQSNEMLRLSLKAPNANWEVVSKGPRLQGLGMVAYGKKLILVGGFQAKNAEGAPEDLHSQSAVLTYDTKNDRWGELPSLPELRSSHDAALIGDTLYVVGGWAMNTPKETEWHQTAWSLNLAAPKVGWTELPKPPFQRRAFTAAAHEGRLYIVGGMDQSGGPSREVAIYDPSTKGWSKGPSIAGKSGMAGFGAATCNLNGKLVVTNMEGNVQVLSKDAASWELLDKSHDARFFHRLLPLDDHQVLAVGGASMQSGKFLVPEAITID